MYSFAAWIEKGAVRRVVVVIKEVGTNEVMERWQFEISNEKAQQKGQGDGEVTG